MSKIYKTKSAEETFAIGSKLADCAKAGDILCLKGELGAGKTVFAKGFAKGLGISAHVTSPTFTLMQIYEEGRLPLYHFDLYRLSGDSQIEPDTLEDIGFFDYLYGEGVCIIEWAEYARDLIPPESTWIEINPDKDGRIIKIGSLT